MSEHPPCDIHLPDEAATVVLGARLGGALVPGDAVFLIGDLGAGKSALARAAIQTALGAEVPVPSPTFTLMQEYEGPRGRIVHADLYRLSDPEEVVELGLDEASGAAAILIEWPERLQGDGPGDRLEIHLTMGERQGRDVTLVAAGPRGEALRRAVLRTRDDLMAAFLSRAGWGDARIGLLAGDASNRRYLRLSRGGERAVLMDAPPERGEDVRPFAAVSDALSARRLSAPEVLARDAAHGFLLLEDLGDALYARICERDPSLETPIYEAAVDLLTGLRALPTDAVPPYDAETLAREASLLTEWWVPDASDDLKAEYLGLIAETTQDVAQDRSALVLRDYHAENLIWLPERRGDARVGLLDYQDALLGHPAYDLVSLLEDARRDLSPGLAEAMIARFLRARPDLEPEAFRAAYDALGAQRNAKIVGIFARLCRRDGKPRYIDLIPRVWAHLMRDLSSDRLAPLRRFVEAHVPAPDAAALQRLRAA